MPSLWSELRRLQEEIRALQHEPTDPPPVRRPAVAPESMPRCRKCGVPLALTSPGFGQASVDAMNLSSGVALCQSCVLD